MRRIIIVLVVLLIASIAWALFERQKNARFTGKFFTAEYNISRDLVEIRWKETGLLSEVDYDRNGDFESDSNVYYGNAQERVSVAVDEDFNGFFEVSYAYSPDGTLLFRQEDIGQDGFMDEYVRYTTDSTYIYRDANLDGHCAETEMIRAKAGRAE